MKKDYSKFGMSTFRRWSKRLYEEGKFAIRVGHWLVPIGRLSRRQSGKWIFINDRSRYSPHYTGKRGIAAARNRAKIESGLIPRDQVLQGRKAA